MNYSGLKIQEDHLSVPNTATPGHLKKLLKTGETLGEATRLVEMRLKIMASLVQSLGGSQKMVFSQWKATKY